MRSLSLLVLILLVGCATESGDPAGNRADASSSSALFGEDLEEEPCAVLTPEILSEVVGVPAADLEQRAMMGRCMYSWEGGQASLGSLDVYESAERAQQRFEQTYRQITPEERERGAVAMREELERRREAGELTEEQARMAGGLADMAGGMAQTTDYEPVSDVGDQAVYDGTVRTIQTGTLGDVTVAESSLYLRLGNLVTTVRADLYESGGDLDARRAGPPPEVRQQNRETTVALARAVLGALR